MGRGWWIGPTGHTAPGRPRPGQFYGEGNSGGSSRLVGRSCHIPVSVRPSVRPPVRSFVCPSQVWAEALFSPRDRAIALQPTPTWVFGDSNPPQKPVAGCSPCCTLAARPQGLSALVHIWRLKPSTGGDAGAGGTPRRTRCCHLDPRQRLSGLRWTCLRGEGVCGHWFGTVRAKYTPRVTRSDTAARARPRFDPSPARTSESLPPSYVG